jgi:hypothetical protein
MSDEQTVIYAARTLQDAFLLRNRLTEEGIRCTVINNELQSGLRVDISWATLARVVVAGEDAELAQRIALDFEHKLAAAAQEPSMESPETAPAGLPPENWPLCPQCKRPRTTSCPICGTAGTTFTAAEADPVDADITERGDEPPEASGCPGSCSCLGTDKHPVSQSPPKQDSKVIRGQLLMLLCPTCDEPFAPEYLRRCEWCNHEFGDGIEPPQTARDDQINNRIVIVIILLALFLLGSLAYLFLIML